MEPTHRLGHRARQAAGIVLLLVGSVAFALAGAELLARLLWRPPVPPPPTPIPEVWRGLPEVRGVHSLQQPNLRVLNGGVLFETNRDGFRGRDRPRQKPAGGFRIALLGDSFAMGWGVVEAETYAARIERILDARDPRPVEVLNFASAGLDTVGAVDRFFQLALPYDPDLVVYGFTVNDLENAHYVRTTPTFAQIQAYLDATPWTLIRVLAPRLGPLQEMLLAPRGTYAGELDVNYFENPPVWEPALAALDRLAAAVREREMCGVVLLHAQLQYLHLLHPYRRHYEAFGETAAARGFHVVPTLPVFVGLEERELWAGPIDMHPGPEAHRLLAERLLDGLDALPERCWRRPGQEPG